MTDYNAADRKAIRERQKAARLADLNRGEVIKSIAATEPGRAYLWDKLASAHIFSTSFHGDALQMAFAEGERNQGLQLLNDIMQWCPDRFVEMMREQNAPAKPPEEIKDDDAE